MALRIKLDFQVCLGALVQFDAQVQVFALDCYYIKNQQRSLASLGKISIHSLPLIHYNLLSSTININKPHLISAIYEETLNSLAMIYSPNAEYEVAPLSNSTAQTKSAQWNKT